MNKIFAIINVVAWAGFWAFGYIAVTADGLSQAQIATAAIIAFAGLVTGTIAYLRLVRASEASGYAAKSNALDAEERRRAQSEGSA